MKIIKYVFLLLLLGAIAVTVFIATQEGKYDIKEQRVIKVPKTVLFNYINEYRNWENVGILTATDTTAQYTYSENTFGEGAQMAWKKDNTKGKIQTVRLTGNDSIIQKAVIDNLNSDIEWGFKDTIGGTRVTVHLKGELSFTEKASVVFKGGVEDKIAASLKKSLDNLNTFLVHELNTFDVTVGDVINKRGVNYIGHAVNSKISEVNKRAGEVFPKLSAFVKTNKMVTDGAPFILYRNFDMQAGTASYVVCIPLKEEIFTTPGSEFEGGKLKPFKALKTTLKGDYSHLRKAWDAASRHIEEKGLPENTTGTYVEVYTRGMKETKKPSELVTDIYIPIGFPTVAPVLDALNTHATGTTAPPATRPANSNNATTKPATTGTGTKPAATNRQPVTKPSAGTQTSGNPAATVPQHLPNEK
jgi:effector-binding domain-containing protein